MLADALNANSPQYLLLDGHGSTRQLVASDGVTLNGSYSYDAYGLMLGGSPTPSSPAATNLLYTGQQYDSSLQQYYLRARYYNPSNGLFNRVDPYSGNLHDPQSLHKYLYCHNNPVNGIDPSGLFMLVGMSMTTKIITLTVTTLITGSLGGIASKMSGGSFFYGAVYGGAMGFVLMQTALFQPHKLPKVIASGLIGGILTALGARLGHWSSGSTMSWDKSKYVDPFMRGFAWSAAAEAYGSGIESKVFVAMVASILQDVIKLIDDIISNGLPNASGWGMFLDVVFNALIAATTTGYMNAFDVDLGALDNVGGKTLKEWLVGICAVPVNALLEVIKEEFKLKIE